EERPVFGQTSVRFERGFIRTHAANAVVEHPVGEHRTGNRGGETTGRLRSGGIGRDRRQQRLPALQHATAVPSVGIDGATIEIYARERIVRGDLADDRGTDLSEVLYAEAHRTVDGESRVARVVVIAGVRAEVPKRRVRSETGREATAEAALDHTTRRTALV